MVIKLLSVERANISLGESTLADSLDGLSGWLSSWHSSWTSSSNWNEIDAHCRKRCSLYSSLVVIQLTNSLDYNLQINRKLENAINLHHINDWLVLTRSHSFTNRRKLCLCCKTNLKPNRGVSLGNREPQSNWAFALLDRKWPKLEFQN